LKFVVTLERDEGNLEARKELGLPLPIRVAEVEVELPAA